MRRVALIFLLALLMAACDAGPVPPTQPAALPTQPPTQVVVITLTPRPTETVAPLPTLDFDIFPYQGNWNISFRFEFNGGEFIEQTRFIGIIPATVDSQGNVTGNGTFNTAVNHDGCFAGIMDDGEVRVLLAGQARLGDSGLVELALELTPEDPSRLENYRLLCPDFAGPQDYQDQLLWPTLEMLGAQPFVLPLEAGAALENTQDLSGPTNGQRQGTLTTEIALSPA